MHARRPSGDGENKIDGIVKQCPIELTNSGEYMLSPVQDPSQNENISPLAEKITELETQSRRDNRSSFVHMKKTTAMIYLHVPRVMMGEFHMARSSKASH